jgi:DNA-binding MarR family transcriptional regulator
MHEDPELTRQAQEIDRRLRAVREVLRRPIEMEIARGGLSGPQRSVMQALVRAEGLSLKELSWQVGLAHSTVSVIVDRLERQGLVKREPYARDRRVTWIRVSEEVRAYLRDTLPRLTISPLVEALRRATPEETGAIVEGLTILHRLLAAGESEA